MNFYLDRQSETPLYIQIKDNITRMIENQILETGAKLPPSRILAKKLGVHRNTVLAAYRELEVEGKISSHIGHGTFVKNNVQPPRHLSLRDELEIKKEVHKNFWIEHCNRKSSVCTIYRSLQIVSEKYISFMQPAFFNNNLQLREMQNCAYLSIQHFGKTIFDSGSPAGLPVVLSGIPRRLPRKGIYATEKNIFIANGFFHALNLIARVFLKSGDFIYTEELLTPAVREIFKKYQVQIEGIPMDFGGMQIDYLEYMIKKKKPRLIFTIPTFHDPTTLTTSIQRRKELLEIAGKYNIRIVEYDYISDINYSETEPVALKGLDTEGLVIFLSSLSKVLLEGLQFSWIVASEKIVKQLAEVKKTFDGEGNCLTQAMIYEFVRRGFYDKLLKRTIRVCKSHRDLTIELVKKYFPEEVNFHPVNGGVFLWFNLPEGVKAYDIAREAYEKKVVIVPKFIFSDNRSIDNGFRLCFVSPSREQLEPGIKILGDILTRAVQASG